ncbi:MAG: type II toxin-antitoxin system HicB family antitoxin [Candidatus Thiosymbion ectosymbiont of Robbea hypermnestra]|nr:type II toxin-antitoxin system HicB family antitoxin [Candidatus Thiosymbion ectosymbiont of Robbea hypermnestra]
MKYLVILEKTETGYSVYSPDLPGCIAVGETQEDAGKNMQEAIEFHLEGLLAEGYTIPEPSSLSNYVELDDFPTVTREQAMTALEQAKELLVNNACAA